MSVLSFLRKKKSTSALTIALMITILLIRILLKQGGESISLFITFYCIILLIILVTQFKVNTFLSFLIVSILAGLLLEMEPTSIITSVQTGIGDLLGSLVIVVISGAMLGKLVAESGAAQKITSGMMKIFGPRYIHWALVATGFIIGIPLFYNVGFVLIVPLIFSVAYRFNLPVVYLGIPMLASLSVTHGFLPPHPSPTALVAQFDADLGKTLMFGLIAAIPTVIIAGPVFAKKLKNLHAQPLETFKPASLPESQLPGLGISIFSSLFPVILISLTTLLHPYLPAHGAIGKMVAFISNADIAMLISLLLATFTLGVFANINMQRIMNIYSEAVKDIAMILLIIAGAGALKQILMDSGVSEEIATALESLNIPPLMMAWVMAAGIRVCIGSATVAGLTAAGILAPLMENTHVDPSLMVLSAGAGSLFFSHVNDSGFWMFKEYFNLSIRDTIRSWSLMETIVSVVGQLIVLTIDALIQ